MDANVRNLLAQLRQSPLDLRLLSALRQACDATESFAVWAEALEEHLRAARENDGDPVELELTLPPRVCLNQIRSCPLALA